MQIGQLALRGLQFLMTLFILALTGNIIHDAFAGNPSIINYVMFVAVFAMLSLIYLIAAAVMDAFAIPIAMLALDALNTLLFLIGGIALAAYLGVHSCGRRVWYSSPEVASEGHIKCHVLLMGENRVMSSPIRSPTARITRPRGVVKSRQ
ncbi:MAG: hypothetical protein LQ352_006046 [Teloschistes flavicans]|nr:MAG: hypothetical protein LQ352_006046 [Teloschistes flavicans]